MIDDEFADWYSTVSVEPFGGSGAWGDTFAAAQVVPCAWEFMNRVITTADGKQVTSDATIQCGAQWRTVLNEGARVTLPDDPRRYRVAQVKTWPGVDSHIEVSLT